MLILFIITANGRFCNSFLQENRPAHKNGDKKQNFQKTKLFFCEKALTNKSNCDRMYSARNLGELCNGSTTDSAYREAVYCQARRCESTLYKMLACPQTHPERQTLFVLCAKLNIILGNCVTAARQTLTLFVGVRIPIPQPERSTAKSGAFFRSGRGIGCRTHAPTATPRRGVRIPRPKIDKLACQVAKRRERNE